MFLQSIIDKDNKYWTIVEYEYAYKNNQLEHILERKNNNISAHFFFKDGIVDSVVNFSNNEIFSIEKYDYEYY